MVAPQKKTKGKYVPVLSSINIRIHPNSRKICSAQSERPLTTFGFFLTFCCDAFFKSSLARHTREVGKWSLPCSGMGARQPKEEDKGQIASRFMGPHNTQCFKVIGGLIKHTSSNSPELICRP